MLRDDRLLHADRRLDFPDGRLSVLEDLHDLETSRVSQETNDLCRPPEHLGAHRANQLFGGFRHAYIDIAINLYVNPCTLGGARQWSGAQGAEEAGGGSTDGRPDPRADVEGCGRYGSPGVPGPDNAGPGFWRQDVGRGFRGIISSRIASA